MLTFRAKRLRESILGASSLCLMHFPFVANAGQLPILSQQRMDHSVTSMALSSDSKVVAVALENGPDKNAELVLMDRKNWKVLGKSDCSSNRVYQLTFGPAPINKLFGIS